MKIPYDTKALIIISFLSATIQFSSMAQIGTDDNRYILKSEMQTMPTGEYLDNSNQEKFALITVIPHLPVLISTDTKSKHLNIELNHPDNDPITVILCDQNNNKILSKKCKCRRQITVSTKKIKSDCFKVNIYHKEGGLLLTSQEIRKNNF